MPKKLSEAHNNKAQQKKNELEKKVHQKRVKNGYGCSFGYFMSLIKVKTMKHRKIRTQCFTISVGIILSYILYVIIKLNMSKLSPFITEYLNNKNILVFGQWFIAILLGNVFSYWYILSVYRPLLPDTKYAGYNYSTGRGNYTDDVDDYIEHSEVHFGKYWDAEKRRNKIEKIYKVTRIIILVQLVISAILFLILK